MSGKDTDDALAAYLTSATLLSVAGEVFYDRGTGYFLDGHVERVRLDGTCAAGTVLGTHPYEVRIRLEDGDLTWSCSCPVGDDGLFCKHLVALGLAVGTVDDGSEDQFGRPPTAYRIRRETLRTHLSDKPREELVALLLERAMEDTRFEDRLRFEIARGDADGPDLAAYRDVIDETMTIRGFVPYGASHGYASDVEGTVIALASLLEEGHPNAVIELAERALSRLEDALGHIDDSGGGMTPLIEELHDLHFRACKKARPDPEALARRLFERERSSDWEIFYQAAERYREILGASGLETYRRLAREEWARVPELKPGDDGSDRFGGRFRITQMMEALASAGGDLDELIDVMSRDLGSPYRFLAIAEVLAKAGEDDRALEWAERGAAAFPETDYRLQAFLAEAYQRRGRRDEALAILWNEFTGRPSVSGYGDLKRHAEAAEAWESWRERALTHLRSGKTRSELVRVFLWEGDVQAAWEASFEGPVSEDLRFRLAQERGEDHPADAIPIYHEEVERTLAQTNKRAYRAAVVLMEDVRLLTGRTGLPDAFEDYVSGVRSRHKRKKNFMILLDRKPW